MAAVRGHLQTVCGDDAAASVEVREAEDEVPLTVEDVDGGDGYVLLPASHARTQVYQLLGVVLLGAFVVGVVRNLHRRHLDDVDAEVLLQSLRRRRNRLVVDVADRNDIDTHRVNYSRQANNVWCHQTALCRA